MLRAIVHASEILTGAGVRQKEGRRVVEEDLGRIVDGALVYEVRKVGKVEVPTRIEWVGATRTLPKKYAKIKKTDLGQKRAIIPGLVDCHNHLIFAGDRSHEFASRCGGATYQEIAAQGGGINNTVQATRKASATDLEKLAIERLRELYAFGVRTVEVKSGYGLSTESELKILKIIPKLRKKFPQMTLTATFLGAHGFPKDQTRVDYMRDLLDIMIPEVARKKLADSCDVFVDEGYYTVAEAREILCRARELGLKIKIHADELGNTESATLAAELGCLSADHLLQISDLGIKKLAASKTVAVLLPGTAFYLKAAHAPARKLIDAGAIVAIATDFNPGTCVTLSLPTVMTIAALYLGMTRAEIFASVTYNAAHALGLENEKGTLEAGKNADFTILPFPKFEEAYYRFAWAPAGDRLL
jgi:imidazolonepropionase